MNFQLIWPSLPLRPYLQFYGLLEAKASKQEVISDIIPPYPCKGLIFCLEERPEARFFNQKLDLNATEGYFMPQCTQSWAMQISGNLKMLGIFFKAGMFRHLFPYPAKDLTDKHVTFEDANALALMDLQTQLLTAMPLKEKIQLIEKFLIRRISLSGFKPSLIDKAMFLLDRQHPASSVDGLAKKIGVSDRYLRKLFIEEIGIPPKAFLRIRRFNIAFNLMRSNQFKNLSDIAYLLQYTDQSHFIKEFRHFTGTTPFRFNNQDHPLHEKLFWRDNEIVLNKKVAW